MIQKEVGKKLTFRNCIAEFRNGINYSKDNFGKGVKVINVKDVQTFTSSFRRFR